jgi:alkyl hydroperoxide reductase subunit AhpC
MRNLFRLDRHALRAQGWADASDTIKKIKYPMIGDPTGAITRNFDVMIEEAGLALRGTFVIDPEGKIRIAEIHELGIGRDAKELLRKVQAAQYVRRIRAKSAPPSGPRALSR